MLHNAEHYAKQCYHYRNIQTHIEEQYAVSDSGKVFFRRLMANEFHKLGGWEEVDGLPNPNYLQYFSTIHQHWMLPG